jgi:hypothetical protein
LLVSSPVHATEPPVTEAHIETNTYPWQPDSAYGCNLYVCIRVVGVGLHVDYVEAFVNQKYSDAASTGSIQFWAGGVVVSTTTPVTIPPNTFLNYWWAHAVLIEGGTVPTTMDVCVNWLGTPGIEGKPCETVHS